MLKINEISLEILVTKEIRAIYPVLEKEFVSKMAHLYTMKDSVEAGSVF